MRRTSFPALVLTAALTAVTLVGCGDETEDPDTTPTSEATTEPTEESTNVREQELITLSEPAEGATVSGSFTASGEANSNEANVPWEIRDESGEVALDGFATAEGWIDKLYPWETTVDVSSLEPGTYTFVAMTDDPSGGAEGEGPQEVAATIVVE